LSWQHEGVYRTARKISSAIPLLKPLADMASLNACWWMNIPIPAASFISSSQGAELVMKSIRLHWIADVVLLMALTIPTLAWTSGADSGLGGPSSVGTTLEDDNETKPAIQTVFLDDYFAFKKRLVDTYGFGFGFDYFALIQAASESPGKDTDGGGVFRAYGSWTLTGRAGADTGNLVYKVENRHRLGTAIAPKIWALRSGMPELRPWPFAEISTTGP